MSIVKMYIVYRICFKRLIFIYQTTTWNQFCHMSKIYGKCLCPSIFSVISTCHISHMSPYCGIYLSNVATSLITTWHHNNASFITTCQHIEHPPSTHEKTTHKTWWFIWPNLVKWVNGLVDQTGWLIWPNLVQWVFCLIGMF